MVSFICSILTTILLLSGKGIKGYEKCGNYICPSYINVFEVRNYQNSWWLSSYVEEKENDNYEDLLIQSWAQFKTYFTAHGYPMTAPLYACRGVNGSHIDTKKHVFKTTLERYKELKQLMTVHYRRQPNIVYVRKVAYSAVADHEARVNSTSLFKDDLINSGLSISRVCIAYYDPEHPRRGAVDLFGLNDNNFDNQLKIFE